MYIFRLFVLYFFGFVIGTLYGEYNIKSTLPSYLYHKFDNLKEDIFPRSIRVKFLAWKIPGNLIYSLDRRLNQLVVTLYDVVIPYIGIDFRNVISYRPLTKICGCELCRFELLDLKLEIEDKIRIECNGIKNQLDYGNKKELIEGYPLPYSINNMSLNVPNEAQLWIVNTPYDKGLYNNILQLSGCIFNVWYNNDPINFTSMAGIIETYCRKTCINDICNGGRCLETFLEKPICNCTKTFKNGEFCNKTIKEVNNEFVDTSYQPSMFKLSWNSSTKEILTMSNKKYKIQISQMEGSLFFEVYNIEKALVSKNILTKNYVPYKEYIIVAVLNENFVDIDFYSNGSWYHSNMFSYITLKDEIFTFQKLQSDDGIMEYVYKESIKDTKWIHIDLTLSQRLVFDNRKDNNSENIKKVEVWSKIIIGILVLTITVIAILLFYIIRKNLRKKLRKNLYKSERPLSDDDVSLVYHDNQLQKILDHLEKIINGSKKMCDKDKYLDKCLKSLIPSLIKDPNPERIKILLENNFIEVLDYIFNMCSLTKNNELLNSLLSMLVFATNNFEDFCKALINTNLFKSLINSLIKHSLTMDLGLSQYYQYYCIIIMFNIIRLPQLRETYKRNENINKVKDILKGFYLPNNKIFNIDMNNNINRRVSCDKNNEQFQVLNILLLGILSNDDDIEIIELINDSNIIENIIKYINYIRDKDCETIYDYDVWELLLGLEALSRIESLKEIIVKTDNVISTLINVMISPSCETKEVNVTLLIIWNLCQVKSIRNFIKKKFEIDKSLKAIRYYGSNLIEEMVRNILKKLDEDQYDIFMSFSDADQNTIFKLEYFLKQCFRVYSKDDNISEFEGEDESKIIISGISNAYFNDESCKSVLLQAYDNKKCIIPLILVNKLEPYGWIEDIIKVSKCFDFFDDSMFEESFLRLCQYIQGVGCTLLSSPKDLQFNNYELDENNQPKEINKVKSEWLQQYEQNLFKIEAKNLSQNKIVNEELTGLQLYSPNNTDVLNHFTELNVEDVSEWLSKSNLPEIHSKLKKCDGTMITWLINMRKENRKKYSRQLKNTFNFTFDETLKFEVALNELEKNFKL